MEIQVSGCSIRNEGSVKLLGIHFNNDLNFDYHVNQLCKKASKKLHALARIAKYMDIKKNAHKGFCISYASSSPKKPSVVSNGDI